jgi:hypothetical protein
MAQGHFKRNMAYAGCRRLSLGRQGNYRLNGPANFPDGRVKTAAKQAFGGAWWLINKRLVNKRRKNHQATI